MSVIFFLVKFFDNEVYARDFVKGRIYANTLATFKTLEGIDDSGRADRHEGTIAWLQPGHGRLEINGMDITDDLAGPTQLQRNWLNHLHIVCLHAVHSGSLDMLHVSNDNTEELRQQLIIPDECRALGEHAVVFDGFRKVLAREFHSVYVYDLRGNQRTSGETSQMEGGKVFGSGSRAGVAVMLLVKRPSPIPQGGAVIRYHDIGDYLSREQKLMAITEAQLDELEWTDITPNEQGDWINQRSEDYLKLRPVAVIQSEDSIPSLTPLFQQSSLGAATNRDAWVFNSSGKKLKGLVEGQVAFYNEQVEALQNGAEVVARDPVQFKWDGTAEQRAGRGTSAELRPAGFRTAIYRPFFRQHFYMDRVLNNSVYQLPRIFPTPDYRTPAILVERGLRAPGRAPAALAVNNVTDGVAGAGPAGRACQVLPRYIFVEPTESPQGELLPVEPHRQDNISDEALDAYRNRYGQWVTKDHIFAYVYGILHSPDYREQYASDLAKMLPRIPEVATGEAFDSFSKAGQQLLDLHIGYEAAEPYPLEERLAPGAPNGPERYRVQRMRWDGPTRAPDRSAIIYNDWITLAGIPDEAHEYVVGPRSALEWLLDRYRVTTDKASGIVNDPNDWGAEIGEPRYVIDLVKRVTTVSVETISIVRALPQLEGGG